LAQRAARLHHVGRQVVHAQIALIAQHEPLRGIEHAQTLGHVVEDGRELRHLPARAQKAKHRRARESASRGGHGGKRVRSRECLEHASRQSPRPEAMRRAFIFG